VLAKENTSSSGWEKNSKEEEKDSYKKPKN